MVVTECDVLAQANEFIESQGFHLMTGEDIPRFLDCATETYGSICYPLDDYFVGHPCTKEEVREMWLFNLKYFYSRAVIYSDSPECNAWMLWIPPGCKGVSVMNFLKLFRPMLDFCAKQGKPVYLETHSPKNVAIYRHFGFEVVSEASIPGTDVTHWGMALDRVMI